MEIRICNLCGKKMDLWDTQQDFRVYTRIQYGSKYDGDDLCLDLCCACMDGLIDACKASPLGEPCLFITSQPK